MSKYKLAAEDEHTFKIQHPDGSYFSVAKNAVGPGVHKRIKALKQIKMSDGGEVPEESDGFNTFFGIGGKKSPLQDDQAFNNFIGVEKTQEAPPTFDPALEGGSSEMPQTNASSFSDLMKEQNRAPQSAPEMPSQNMMAPTQTAPMAEMPNNDYAKAFALKESGIKDIAGAQSRANQAQADAYQSQINQMAAQQAHYEQEHAKLDTEHKQLFDGVMSSKIDPNRMYHNMGTGSKVMAGIGVVLAGIGAGLLHQSNNVALDVINKSIDQDIDAQKSDLGKKQTLLSDNIRRFGDLNSATQMTRLQLNAVTQAQIAKAAAQSGSVQAQANAKMMLGDLQMQSAQIKQQATIKQMASQGGSYDPAVLVPHIVPKEHQKAVFDEIERAQDTRHMGDSILKSFDQAEKENTIFKTGAGLFRTPPGVLAFHQSMQPTFKDLEGTVRQAAMDNTFRNLTPAPGDAPDTIKTKREALQAYLQSKMAAPTARGFGIDLDKFGSTTTRAMSPPVERMDPKSGRIVLYDAATKKPLGYKQ